MDTKEQLKKSNNFEGEFTLNDQTAIERERQLFLALVDCTNFCYDVNFTKNQIISKARYEDREKDFALKAAMGMPIGGSFSDFVKFWGMRMTEDERQPFYDFFNIERILNCYKSGDRLIIHKCLSPNSLGELIQTYHKIRLYEDLETGDVLGFCYIVEDKDYQGVIKKEKKLEKKNKQLAQRTHMFENLAASIPSGYHRCGPTEGFPLYFVSDSFIEIVGWTREELKSEFDNKFINLVAPEDRQRFMSMEPELVKNGRVDAVYRLLRKDGTRRWVQDATVRVEQDREISYQCTLADITKHVEMLNEQKERAEEANRAKTTFLFNASHDIRTPMNAIQGFAHIIEENADNPEVVRQTIAKIKQSSGTLMTLLNDILELSRIEKGKEKVNYQSIDLNDHIARMVEMFTSEMESKSIKFEIVNKIEKSLILGDDLKLTRISMNMLSNAKKFTPNGGKVTFGIEQLNGDYKGATYCIYVKDTGIGMSEEFQKKAFEQFERERTSTDSKVGGSGLGLAIIKKFVDLMDGECEIHSKMGQGTEICVKIRFEFVDQENQKIADNDVIGGDLSGKRVLLVEDNEFNREIARYILQGLNLEVDEAENGLVCLEKLKNINSAKYDVVLMDIQMPVMDGYVTTKQIRSSSNPLIKNIPIIALTANAFNEDRQKCLEAGMNGHIGKPFEAKAVINEIHKVFGK